MAKVGGAYPHLLGGVSLKYDVYRDITNHVSQDNLLVDPVRGLVRRHGTIRKATCELAALGTTSDTDDLSTWRSIDFRQDGKDYVLTYRRTAKVAGATFSGYGLLCYNKTDDLWLPVVLANPSRASELVDVAFGLAGYACAVAAGKLLVLPVADSTPAYTTVAKWDETNANGNGILWCRAGNYSRTYTVKATFSKFSDPQDTVQLTVSHTTPASTYGGVLDTSSIAATDPAYTKKVTDLTTAYNNAVAAWAISAAEDIRPGTIVGALNTALAAACVTAGMPDAYVAFIDGGCLVLSKGTNTTWKLKALYCTDGGDNSTLTATDMEVPSADGLPPVAPDGMVVRVAPSASSYYYLEVTRQIDDSGELSTTWRECAGNVVTPTRLGVFGEIHDGELRISTHPEDLPAAFPAVASSVSGDSYVPSCFSAPITCAFVFQNRLALGANGVLNFSRVGDYTNFFPESSLAEVATDPIEMQAIGRTSDSLLHAVPFERNVLVFGREATYVLNGETVLTPSSDSLSVQARYEDLANCTPVQTAGSLYFAQAKYGSTSVKQMLPGNYAQSLATFPTSDLVDGYLEGEAIQFCGSSYHGVLALRTAGLTHGVYVYRFLESRNGQVLGAWSRFTWNTGVGRLMSVTSTAEGFLLLFGVIEDGVLYASAELLSLSPLTSELPLLDSLRSSSAGLAADARVSIAPGSPYALHSADAADAVSFLAARPSAIPSAVYYGYDYSSCVRLTNPSNRNKDGDVILQGNLTISQIRAVFTDTAEAEVRLGAFGAEPLPMLTVRATRVAGTAPSVVHVGDFSKLIPIGRDRNTYELELASIGIMPMTIAGLEWEGLLFSYRR